MSLPSGWMRARSTAPAFCVRVCVCKAADASGQPGPERGQSSWRLHGALDISSWDVPKLKAHLRTHNQELIITAAGVQKAACLLCTFHRSARVMDESL